MGEITATLKGKIRVVTSLDFVQIFSMLANLDKKCKCLAEYICELSLLQAEMGQYSPAEIAASCVLLAKLLMKLENPWSHQMVQFTGYTIEDISRCAFHMHEKCFLEGSVVDHRDVTLQAVKLRYSEEKLYKVSEMSIMSYEELCAMLGVTEHILQGTDVRVKFKNSDELILSPSRKKRRCIERNMPDLQERESAATPTMEDSMILNESVMSGYYGDREDEDESFYEFDESSEASGHSEMEQMGSESDTYFASISSGSKSLPKTMTLNLSFSGICNISPIKPKSTINCDTECSSSGVSLSPSSAAMSDSPRPSSSSGHPILPNSPLGISGHSSHIWRRSSARKSKIVSDSDCDSPRSAEKQGSTSYMTLRRTTKRKSRRALCTSTTQS
ncbi:hypothetical protein FSP39_024406 [Pinctada imbricata]|uniref:Cyclin N-terminal domain-containing protein n=1 Tax=Pinctada imbricata TaxID=66713 RepID=A0AA89C2J0_PINIB|nr:hypothetical protein FSP39_024406 [Pinctada imbricata]